MGVSTKHAALVALGFEVALIVVGSILAGLKLDSVLNCSPVLLVVGAILGMVGSTYRVLKIAKSLDSR